MSEQAAAAANAAAMRPLLKTIRSPRRVQDKLAVCGWPPTMQAGKDADEQREGSGSGPACAFSVRPTAKHASAC